MSQTSQSFIDQLESALGEEKYPSALKSFPAQIDPEDDDGEWVTGDPDLPIDWEFKGDSIKKADKQVEKDRKTQGALSELASLFKGITGQEPEEEPKVLEPVPLPEETNIVPFIDPKVIEQGAKQLQELFTDISGMELFGERPKFEEEEVIDIPVTPPETFDISEITSTFDKKDLNGSVEKVLQDSTYYDPKDFERTQIVQDVDALLEKHRAELPKEQYEILKTDAADKTAEYLSKLNLKEFEVPNSMPFTGAPNPLVTSGQFTTAVTGILRKMMATGPGTGVVEITELDDVDASNISATHQFLAWDAGVKKFVAAEGTTPVGDITGVTAGNGLSGGGNQGVVELALDVSELTALGATAAFGDYVVIQDVTDNTTKKVLVSNLPASSGVITGVDAGTGLSGGGSSGTVTLNVEASQTQITALGTIGTGTWQGTAIADGYLGTGINANKLANGSVTNTELQYINSLTSNAQTQIDSKAGNATVTAMAIALG